MILNGLMKKLLENEKDAVPYKDQMDITDCVDKLVKDIAYECGCLFMKTYNGIATTDNQSSKVEFEAWHNEILINSEFPKRRITAAFAMEFYICFCERLMKICSEKICLVMSEDVGLWTFRFHIVRNGEPLWISEDPEEFAQPILYDILG